VMVSVIMRKKSSYELVSNSEWLPRESCLTGAHCSLLEFCLWSWM